MTSRSEKKYRTVDMQIIVCDCPKGQDGSPCPHQHAIAHHLLLPSMNAAPACSVEEKRKLATLTLGSKSRMDIEIFASIHEAPKCQDQPKFESQDTSIRPTNEDYPDIALCESLSKKRKLIGDNLDKDEQTAKKKRQITSRLESLFDNTKD